MKYLIRRWLGIDYEVTALQQRVLALEVGHNLSQEKLKEHKYLLDDSMAQSRNAWARVRALADYLGVEEGTEQIPNPSRYVDIPTITDFTYSKRGKKKQ